MGYLRDPQIIPYGVFRARWTDAERAALFALEQTNWQVRDLIALATAQDGVNLASPGSCGSQSAVRRRRVLTQERADELFPTI